MDRELLNEIRERVHVERLIDNKVSEYRASEEYQDFLNSTNQFHDLIFNYEDNHGVIRTTRVRISKTKENLNSKMNKSEKFKKLQKLIIQEKLC